jgi:hypothetical protein
VLHSFIVTISGEWLRLEQCLRSTCWKANPDQSQARHDHEDSVEETAKEVGKSCRQKEEEDRKRGAHRKTHECSGNSPSFFVTR